MKINFFLWAFLLGSNLSADDQPITAASFDISYDGTRHLTLRNHGNVMPGHYIVENYDPIYPTTKEQTILASPVSAIFIKPTKDILFFSKNKFIIKPYESLIHSTKERIKKIIDAKYNEQNNTLIAHCKNSDAQDIIYVFFIYKTPGSVQLIYDDKPIAYALSPSGNSAALLTEKNEILFYNLEKPEDKNYYHKKFTFNSVDKRFYNLTIQDIIFTDKSCLNIIGKKDNNIITHALSINIENPEYSLLKNNKIGFFKKNTSISSKFSSKDAALILQEEHVIHEINIHNYSLNKKLNIKNKTDFSLTSLSPSWAIFQRPHHLNNEFIFYFIKH